MKASLKNVCRIQAECASYFTDRLIEKGELKRLPCAVCGKQKVIAHHEDYSRPTDILWLCEKHHKKYHDGKIGLFKNKLWWNPSRLIPKKIRREGILKKYKELKKQFRLNKRQNAEQWH